MLANVDKNNTTLPRNIHYIDRNSFEETIRTDLSEKNGQALYFSR